MPRPRTVNKLTENQDQIIRPITLEIKKSLWENFKSILSKDETLNQALIRIIQGEIKRKRK